MSEIIKLPHSVTRRLHSRKPRRSKNGTPEERAARRAGTAPATVSLLPHGKPSAANHTADLVKSAYKTNSNAHAALRRAAEIITALRALQDRDGWALDEERASLFLHCMCELNPKDGDSEEMKVIIEWVKDHGQSLDWIFCGDARSMIVRAATTASGTSKRNRPKLVTIPQDDPPAPNAA